MEAFEEGKVTIRTWVDTETKKLDAGRPEVQLYQASRESQIMKLWYSERYQEAIDLATAELKALRVEKASARGYQEQKFFELLSIPYLMCRAHDQLRLGRYELALKDIEAIFAVEQSTSPQRSKKSLSENFLTRFCFRWCSVDIPAPQHYVLKSTALSALGRIDEAWEATAKALEYGPEERDVLEHASIILEARGDWEKLIEVTDKLSEIYEIHIQGMVRLKYQSNFHKLGPKFQNECSYAFSDTFSRRARMS